MKILGIDTSTMMGSAGIIEDDMPLGQFSLNIETTHSERLMEAIVTLLSGVRVTLEEIDCFAISIGPGSFTGLRIGLGTVKGLSMATGKDVVPVSTLEALALNIPFCRHLICPILDARKKEVYTALFKYGNDDSIIRLTDDMVISPGLLTTHVKGPVVFTGDGVHVYRDQIMRQFKDYARFAPVNAILPSGISVARMGLQNLRKGIAGSGNLVPVYIRKSEAEVKLEVRRKK